ncbi:hypothetical protein D3C74_358550 [compost metagenome]
MAGQQVEQHLVGLLRVTHQKVPELLAKTPGVHIAVVEVFNQTAGQRIIHHGIELISV